MTVVLDASALLAFLHNEQGGQAVADALEDAMVSTVNWAEVVQKAIRHDVEIRGMREDFEGLGVRIAVFSSTEAELAASLWPKTRALGLSLADHACLALALVHECPVVTADRAWMHLDLDLEIRLIR